LNVHRLRTELGMFARAPSAWLARSAHRRSFGAAIIVGVVTFGGALLRMAKDLALAAWFGTHQDVDAYLLALAIPLFSTSVLAGSLNSVLIPVYIDVRQSDGESAADRLVTTVVCAAALLMGAVSCLLLLIGPALLGVLAGRLGAPELALARRLYPMAAPIVITSGLSTVLGGLLNARGWFALPALTPALSSLVPLIVLAMFPNHRSIEVIAGGTLAGYVVELLVLAAVFRSAAWRPPGRWEASTGATRRVLGAYVPMFGGMIVSCASPVVDQLMATRLGSGAVATLSFAGKAPAFIMGLGGVAVGTAVLPHFSRLVAAGDSSALRRSLWAWTALIVIAYVPIVILGSAFARPLIRLLFERGAFHASDTETTARVFLGYLPQLPFYVLGILASRLLSVLGRARLLMYFAFLNVVTNFIGDYVLMRYLGLPGIALSTSIVCLGSTSVMFLALRNIALLRSVRPAVSSSM
jgi:putative peptidoglycan lipid II flippase